MKQLFFILILFTQLSNSYAQDKKISLGIKGGLNIAYITNLGYSGSSSNNTGSGYSTTTKNSRSFLPHFGAYSVIRITNFLSLQPEFLLSVKGYKNKYNYINPPNISNSTSKLALQYLDIPIQLKFNIDKRFYVLAGPYVGILMNATKSVKSNVLSSPSEFTSNSNYKTTSKNGFHLFEIGSYLGLGYQLKNRLSIGIRWCRGFNNIYQSNGYIRSNSVYQISVEFTLKTFNSNDTPITKTP